jgi:hypothetical protein
MTRLLLGAWTLVALVGCDQVAPSRNPLAPTAALLTEAATGATRATPQHESSRPAELLGNPQCDVTEVAWCKVLWLVSASGAAQPTIVRIELWREGRWIPFDTIVLPVGARDVDWRPKDDQRGQFRWFAGRIDPGSADVVVGRFSF